ncbi:hypothetical protein SUDANB70_04222 [Streptomyces sp. enrichment culture]
MNRTAPAKRGVRMTIQVLRVDRHGRVLEDRGTVVSVGTGETPPPTSCAWPPCRCPRHRQAVTS